MITDAHRQATHRLAIPSRICIIAGHLLDNLALLMWLLMFTDKQRIEQEYLPEFVLLMLSLTLTDKQRIEQ